MKNTAEKITITSTVNGYVVTLHRAKSQGGAKERVGTFTTLDAARNAKRSTEAERN